MEEVVPRTQHSHCAHLRGFEQRTSSMVFWRLGYLCTFSGLVSSKKMFCKPSMGCEPKHEQGDSVQNQAPDLYTIP